MSHDPVCAYCRKPGKLDRDHVVPRSRGGPDDATNIVMACEECNSAKSAQLPSEWLGDRCPPPVLLIEARVHAKLKSSFKKRDYRRQQPAQPEPTRLYAFHTAENGAVDFMGEVVNETADTVRVDTLDAMTALFGLWFPSGELKDLPKKECRLFADKETCLQSALMTLPNRQRS